MTNGLKDFWAELSYGGYKYKAGERFMMSKDEWEAAYRMIVDRADKAKDAQDIRNEKDLRALHADFLRSFTKVLNDAYYQISHAQEQFKHFSGHITSHHGETFTDEQREAYDEKYESARSIETLLVME